MLSRFTRYPGTAFLLLISVLVRVLNDIFPGTLDLLAFDPRHVLSGILGSVTHQVTHGGWGHLIGNFTFGLPFMAYLEGKLGRSRFEEYFILSGLCSAVLQTLLGGPGMLVGSSGAIFGCMVGACVSFGETTFDHCAALLVLACMLAPQLLMASSYLPTGVAFWGHVGGSIGGMLLSQRLHRAY